MISKLHLIDDINEQMTRVWGPEGFGGGPDEYQWLQTSCEISEEEDVRWQEIVEHSAGEIEPEDEEVDHEFLNDDKAVVPFLEAFLKKYKSAPSIFPRKFPADSIQLMRWKLHDHCFRHGCAVIEAESLSGAGSQNVLRFEAFLRAIAAEKPAAVYWTQAIFDIDEFIESELQSLGWEPGDEDDEDSDWPRIVEIKSALTMSIKRVAAFDASPYEMEAMFPGSRISKLRARWASELASDIREFVEQKEDEAQASSAQDEAENEEHFQSFVSELLTNEVFRKTRGLKKRLLLAQNLIGSKVPTHPNHSLTRITPDADFCDLNMVKVVKAAAEQIWIETSLQDGGA